MTAWGTIASSLATCRQIHSATLQGKKLMGQASLPVGADIKVITRPLLPKPSNATALCDPMSVREECLTLAESSDLTGIGYTSGMNTHEETSSLPNIILSGLTVTERTGSQRVANESETDTFSNIADVAMLTTRAWARSLGTVGNILRLLRQAEGTRTVCG